MIINVTTAVGGDWLLSAEISNPFLFQLHACSKAYRTPENTAKLSNKISIHILIDRQVDNTPPTDLLKGRVQE